MAKYVIKIGDFIVGVYQEIFVDVCLNRLETKLKSEVIRKILGVQKLEYAITKNNGSFTVRFLDRNKNTILIKGNKD